MNNKNNKRESIFKDKSFIKLLVIWSVAVITIYILLYNEYIRYFSNVFIYNITHETNYNIGKLEKDFSYKQINYLSSKIPKKLVKQFYESGWKFGTLDKSKIAYDSHGIMGITLDKIILLDESTFSLPFSVIHEFGHYIDVSNGNLAYEKNWQEIYKKEKDNYKPKELIMLSTSNEQEKAYVTSNESEFFAEIFKQTILFPKKTKKNTPLAYEYMKELIEKQ